MMARNRPARYAASWLTAYAQSSCFVGPTDVNIFGSSFYSGGTHTQCTPMGGSCDIRDPSSCMEASKCVVQGECTQQKRQQGKCRARCQRSNPFAYYWPSRDALLSGSKGVCKNASEAQDILGPIGRWDVSGVSDLSYLFCASDASRCTSSDCNWAVPSSNCDASCTGFNEPVGLWSTKHVTSIEGIFHGASSFNQPLTRWDISRVTKMKGAFTGANSFRQPVNRMASEFKTKCHDSGGEEVCQAQSGIVTASPSPDG